MPLNIIRQDITKVKADAIVNAANSTLLGGGGVDGCIHQAAGPKLLKACEKLGGCEPGDAKLTKGYQLPCKYVIHTVGPVWQGGNANESELLTSCYTRSLELAKQHRCQSIAFPLISSGAYGYPKDKALNTAINAISTFLQGNDMLVYLVVFDKTAYQLSESLYNDISSYIDDNYVEQNYKYSSRIAAPQRMLGSRPSPSFSKQNVQRDNAAEACNACYEDSAVPKSLNDALLSIDETFTQMLLRLIDEKGITDAQCYKKANIDRKLFSKIRSDIHYKPSKRTALAFAIALQLPMPEVKDMLMKAGYALSHSNKFDIIVEYFINSGNYNIHEINEALFAFDQTLLC